jgi:hypothetical protein
MNAVLHIAWKEYRTLRGLWIAVALLAAMVQGLVAVFSEVHGSRESAVLFALTAWMPALYALGCAATMFAAEKDDGTYDWLSAIPLDGLRILAGKLLYTLPSTLLLFAVVTLTSRAFDDGEPYPRTELFRQSAILWGVAAYEAVAWGMLVSLLSKRPLQSAIIAVAIGSTVTHGVVAFFVDRDWNVASYLSATAVRLALATVVAVVDIFLAHRWLHPPRRWQRVKSHVPPARVVATEQFPTTSGAIRRRQLSRHLWLQWRVSRGIVLAMLATAFLLPFLLLSLSAARTTTGLATAMFGFLTFMFTMLGAWTFRGDHEGQQYRFLVDRAISPRWVWWARESFWIAAVYACLLAAAVACFFAVATFRTSFTLSNAPNSWFFVDPKTTGVIYIGLTVLLAPLIPFAAGQFTSLVIRSPLLAATAGLTIAGALMAWGILMARLQIAWWWTLAPPVIALFVATRYRIADWLTERNTWRSWVGTLAIVVVPCLAIPLGVIAFRVYEIPGSVNGVSLADEPAGAANLFLPPTPDEQETDLRYRVIQLPARNDYPLLLARLGLPRNPEVFAAQASDEEIAEQRRMLLSEYSESLTQLMDASRRRSCVFVDPRYGLIDGDPQILGRVWDYVLLLTAAGEEAEAEGELEKAFQYYAAGYRFAKHLANRAGMLQAFVAAGVRNQFDAELRDWAAQPGQTKELLEKARQIYLDAHAKDFFTDATRATQLAWQRRIDEGQYPYPASAGNPNDPYTGTTIVGINWPWEKARQLRLLRLDAHLARQLFDGQELAVNQNGVVRALNKTFGRKVVDLLRTTPLPEVPGRALEALIGPSHGSTMYDIAREQTSRIDVLSSLDTAENRLRTDAPSPAGDALMPPQTLADPVQTP